MRTQTMYPDQPVHETLPQMLRRQDQEILALGNRDFRRSKNGKAVLRLTKMKHAFEFQQLKLFLSAQRAPITPEAYPDPYAGG